MPVRCIQEKGPFSGQGFLLFTSYRSNIHGRLYVTKTQFQVFEDVLGGEEWWKRWMQWLFDNWGHAENTGLREVSVDCIGDILMCLLLKMQSALSCWHAVFPGRIVAMNTDTGTCPAQSWDDSVFRCCSHPVLTACVRNFIWGLNYPKYWKANYIVVLCLGGTHKMTCVLSSGFWPSQKWLLQF